MMNNQMQYEVRPLVRAEDLVAQIMWRDPVVLPPKFRINEAIERVRQVGLPNENMNHCYVVDEDCTLFGPAEPAGAAADPGRKACGRCDGAAVCHSAAQ